jgi:GT2 family glycosyltransferase
MAFSFPKASIVVATYNNAKVLRRVLDAMLALDYPAGYEIIVVDDGSKDGTAEMMRKEFSGEPRIRFLRFEKNQGVCRARNAGIEKALFPIVVNMDHDCIPEKKWLREMVKPFADAKVGIVSSFGAFGGTSTAFRRELLQKVQGYDERYRYYREDTDLTFSIMDLGYRYVTLPKPMYVHDHKEAAPRGLLESAKYVLKRLRYHENDVLLYKKHPKLAGKFLDVKLGFIVNPAEDFRVVVNRWEGSDRELKLGSPRGITFIENKSALHGLLIIFLGLVYVAAVKAFRLLGSLKFGKLLA